MDGLRVSGPDPAQLTIRPSEAPRDLLPPDQLKFGRSFTGK